MDNLQNEEMRGEQARSVLDNPIYRESYKAVEDRIVDQLGLADLDKDRREKLNNLLVAHRTLKRYMETVLTTGTMAAMEINRKKTLAERFRFAA